MFQKNHLGSGASDKTVLQFGVARARIRVMNERHDRGGDTAEQEGNKLQIMATVIYGEAQITQTWEYLESNGILCLILHRAADGTIVIPLANDLTRELPPGITPRKTYVGILKASGAIRLNSDGKRISN
jgi:hypothetical protein